MIRSWPAIAAWLSLAAAALAGPVQAEAQERVQDLGSLAEPGPHGFGDAARPGGVASLSVGSRNLAPPRSSCRAA